MGRRLGTDQVENHRSSRYGEGVEVQHKPDEGRFVLTVRDQEAELLYNRIDHTILEYSHTFVPPELRGSGAGGKIVRAALDYAREEGYSVRPTCSFVAAFIERHPEYKEILQ